MSSDAANMVTTRPTKLLVHVQHNQGHHRGIVDAIDTTVPAMIWEVVSKEKEETKQKATYVEKE